MMIITIHETGSKIRYNTSVKRKPRNEIYRIEVYGLLQKINPQKVYKCPKARKTKCET